jgi:hypothetical protein
MSIDLHISWLKIGAATAGGGAISTKPRSDFTFYFRALYILRAEFVVKYVTSN